MQGTAIQVIRQAAAELGLRPPVSAVASREVQSVQMLALLNAAGNDLCRMFEWQFLRRTGTIPMTVGVSDYPLPADFSKLINDTLWQKSNVTSVMGPVGARAWAYLKNSLVLAPEYCFIIKDNQFQFSPPPSEEDGGEITYEYISNGWAQDATIPTTRRPLIMSDLDVVLFDFWLAVKALKLKLWHAKGLDTTALLGDFNRYFSDSTAQDHGAPTLSLTLVGDVLPPPLPPNTGFGI